MDLTDGVDVEYIVKDSKDSSLLETAVDSFPALVHFIGFHRGSTPKMLASRDENGDVLLKPHNCVFGFIHLDEDAGVDVLREENGSRSCRWDGKNYSFLNVPIYG